MKKIILSFMIVCISIFGSTFLVSQVSAEEDKSGCLYKVDNDGNVVGGMDGLLGECIGGTSTVKVDNATISSDGGFKGKIQGWTQNIATFLGLLAVGSIIYGGLMMTLSAGEDEKIKKAKDIVKWSLIGFLGVIMASSIVTLVINLIYGFSYN